MNCNFQEHSDVNATEAYTSGLNLAWIKILLWLKLRTYVYAGTFGNALKPRESGLTWILSRLTKLFSKDLLAISGGGGVPYQETFFHLIKRKHLLIRKEGPTQIIFLSCYDRTQISLRLL